MAAMPSHQEVLQPRFEVDSGAVLDYLLPFIRAEKGPAMQMLAEHGKWWYKEHKDKAGFVP